MSFFFINFGTNPYIMKRSALLLLLSVGLLANPVFSQTFDFAMSFGGTSLDWPLDMEIDASGNIYMCGYFWNTVDFDPGVGVVNRTSNGNEDCYVAKYSPTGSLLWVETFGGTNLDRASGLAVDGNGNVIVTGRFQGNVLFPGNLLLASHNSGGNIDGFMLKLSSSGAFLNLIGLGGNSSSVWGNDVDITDDDNFVYICGGFTGLFDADGMQGTLNLQSGALIDAFIGLYNANTFNVSWAVNPSGAVGNEEAVRLKYDSFGRTYTTGTFNGLTDFDPSGGTYNLNTNGGLDVFVLKLDGNGDIEWARGFGGSTNDVPKAIDIDNQGNVVTVGQFTGTADMDPSAAVSNFTSNGVADGFLNRISDAGNFVDALAFTGTDDDMVHSLDIDASGNFLLGGYFKGDIDIDPSTSSSTILTSSGNFDSFFCELNSTLQFQWGNQVGGTDLNRLRLARYQFGNDQAIAGDFFNSFTVGSTTLTSNGSSDIYFARFFDITISIEEQHVELGLSYNPKDRTISVKATADRNELRLYDLTGKLLFDLSITGQSIERIPSFPSGIYVAEISNSAQRKSIKIAIN